MEEGATGATLEEAIEGATVVDTAETVDEAGRQASAVGEATGAGMVGETGEGTEEIEVEEEGTGEGMAVGIGEATEGIAAEVEIGEGPLVLLRLTVVRSFLLFGSRLASAGS